MKPSRSSSTAATASPPVTIPEVKAESMPAHASVWGRQLMANRQEQVKRRAYSNGDDFIVDAPAALAVAAKMPPSATSEGLSTTGLTFAKIDVPAAPAPTASKSLLTMGFSSSK
jgi:hypothetical protein